jgi:hypothetical protein
MGKGHSPKTVPQTHASLAFELIHASLKLTDSIEKLVIRIDGNEIDDVLADQECEEDPAHLLTPALDHSRSCSSSLIL